MRQPSHHCSFVGRLKCKLEPRSEDLEYAWIVLFRRDHAGVRLMHGDDFYRDEELALVHESKEQVVFQDKVFTCPLSLAIA